jgi:outer membrane biosynthesis protein TonB
MPGWLRWALVTLALGLLAVATFVAQRQAPHPDMFRPAANGDIGNADWWAYPLERNAFKRRVVRGHLWAMFVLPNTQTIWAVGEGGLVLHSADGGSNWVQQRPAVAARTADNGRQARAAGAWSPFSEALAEQPDSKQQAAPNLAAQQKPDAPPLSEVAANPATQAVAPERIPNRSPKAEPAPAKPLANAREPTPAPPPGNVDVKAGAKAREPVSPPIGPTPDNANLNAVFFATERLGWAVGDNGTIRATRDGGNAWTPQTSGT